jgi:hypothetical protein
MLWFKMYLKIQSETRGDKILMIICESLIFKEMIHF